MIKYISLPILFCTLFTLSLHSQSATDALRYSNFEVGGTARSMGVGGALGALGADFSVISTNPAGMAWYRSSVFVISPTFYRSSTEASLTNGVEGTFSEENRNNFNLNSFGLVAASSPRNPDWAQFNFGIGFNRLANFHNDFFYEGSSIGSIMNRFRDQVNGPDGISDFESGLAFDNGALFDLEGDGIFESDFDFAPDASIYRRQNVERRGAINELVFSFAGNYREKLMIGATLGVPFVSFREEKVYTEIDRGPGEDGNVPFFEELEYTEELNTNGAGVNLKLGMIYRANQSLRLGLAVHTPTAYSLQDDFRTSLLYIYTDDGQIQGGTAESPDGLFEYRLRTPWRFIGSAGYIYKKLGFLSADIEYVDFTNNEFRYDGFDESEQLANQGINERLTRALRLRLGGEVAYKIFRFRAGVNLLQSPIEGDDTINTTFSGGLGVRQRGVYFDVAYQVRNIEQMYTPYLVSDNFETQDVLRDQRTGQLVFTLGFRFQ
jgi:hypothetical protein